MEDADLKDNFAVGRHGNPITVCEGECLVVVKDGVQVLDPNGVHGAVQDQPDVVALQ